jgi:hypothetical protein
MDEGTMEFLLALRILEVVGSLMTGFSLVAIAVHEIGRDRRLK